MGDTAVAKPRPVGIATRPVDKRRRPCWAAYENPEPLEDEGDCNNFVKRHHDFHSTDNAIILGFFFAFGIYVLIALAMCLLLV